jgi:general secretion pathway protein N
MRAASIALVLCCLAAPSASGRAQEAGASLKLDDLSATREMPLFAPDRRPKPPPPAAPATAAQQPVAPPARFALRGIIDEGSQTFVLLQDAGTSESVLVPAGGTVGEWKVTVENDHSVTLSGAGEPIHLEMFADEEPEASK